MPCARDWPSIPSVGSFMLASPAIPSGPAVLPNVGPIRGGGRRLVNAPMLPEGIGAGLGSSARNKRTLALADDHILLCLREVERHLQDRLVNQLPPELRIGLHLG